MNVRAKFLALAAIGALLVALGCRNEAATTTTSANEVGRFQLVGKVEDVTTGVEPELDVDVGTPAAGENTPSETGAMDVRIQSASDALRDTCGIDRDEEVKVWWFTTTRFDPAKVVSDVEDELDGSRVSAQGRIFGTGASSTAAAPTSPSPATSPGAATTADCVLVADHVEVHQGSGAPGGPSSPRPTVSASPGVLTTPPPTASPGAPTQ